MSAPEPFETTKYDVDAIRREFPILAREVNASPLVYLDNAATTQKPRAVVDRLSNYYYGFNANVHRGAHALSDQATRAFEEAREKVRAFINAASSDEIIWTRGTTESINLVASSFAGAQFKEGDEILVSMLAHHSNIVPWQFAAARCNAKVIPIPVRDTSDLDLSAFKALLNGRTRLVALEHVSNALGTVHPVAEVIEMAHRFGAAVLVDGAQAAAHFPLDVQALNADFYAFSGHKMFGPTGIGVLFGKRELLDAMPPYQGGGEMIDQVSFEGTTFAGLPYRFEAGTPNIADAIALGSAVDWIRALDRDAVAAHETTLLESVLARAERFQGFRLIGNPGNRVSIVSFLIDGTHPHDVGTLLDQQGIAVRTGHHCTQPLMARFGIPGTVRASFCLYNTLEEVDRLFNALEKVKSFL